NSKRELHGALLDAQILAEIYLAMTGGQVSLSLGGDEPLAAAAEIAHRPIERQGLSLVVLRANDAELAAHEAMLARIAKRAGRPIVWAADEPLPNEAPERAVA